MPDLSQTVITDIAGRTPAVPTKEGWPWYHTADEIHTRLSQLAGECRNASVKFFQRSDSEKAPVQVDVLTVSRPGGGPKTRAMFVFGMHAREIITSESALHFVESLCGIGHSGKRASDILDHVSFTIIPLANPVGRTVVDEGYNCWRKNERGVDLNRNFGNLHRYSAAEEPGTDEGQYPGPSGFSEPESRIVKGVLEELRPEIYLAVHSGDFLLGTPYGYNAERTPEDEARLLEVLRPISEKYCGGECPYGNLAKLVKYKNPGCDMDYALEAVAVPYAFTWEIYGGRPSGYVGNYENCMQEFNPTTQEETHSVLEQWTGAYLELCELVVARTGVSHGSAQPIKLIRTLVRTHDHR